MHSWLAAHACILSLYQLEKVTLVRREIKRDHGQKLFCFPGGDVSRCVCRNQPCSCDEARGRSNHGLACISSLTFYPGLPANHHPDLSGQSAWKRDTRYEFTLNMFLSFVFSYLGRLCHCSWTVLRKIDYSNMPDVGLGAQITKHVEIKLKS